MAIAKRGTEGSKAVRRIAVTSKPPADDHGSRSAKTVAGSAIAKGRAAADRVKSGVLVKTDALTVLSPKAFAKLDSELETEPQLIPQLQRAGKRHRITHR
jgi:hypothetical protein